LYESLTPKLDQFGVEHVQATGLTILITLAFLSVISGWLNRAIISYYDGTATPNSAWLAKTFSVFVPIVEHTILKLPKMENKWLISFSLLLYFFESYRCTTRYLLANTLASATDLEAYIDGLKQEPPVVTWKVQTFHYELRRVFAVSRMIRSLFRSLKKARATQEIPKERSTQEIQTSTISPVPLGDMDLSRKESRHTSPIFFITRKVITNEASATYRYASCSDKTIAGVWSRAPSNERVPFRKISLSKILVLSDKRSREDYFRQQSDFVTRYGREDRFAEFSTSIEVAGYRPRLLVIRSPLSHNDDKIDYKRWFARLPVFWLFTCLGLTVPYRVWFKRHCELLRVTVVKETKARSASDSYLRSWFPSQASLRLINKSAPGK